MREWIARNQTLVTIALIVVIAVALAVLLWPGKDQPHDVITDQAWYYDVVTGQVFRDKRMRVPPIKSPDGNEAVRVVFFTCGHCDEDERFVGYYVKFTDQMKKKAEQDEQVLSMTFAERCEGRLYSTDAVTWVAAPTAEEAGVLEHFRDRCTGKGRLRMCP